MALQINELHNGYGDTKILHGITATIPEGKMIRDDINQQKKAT